MKAGLDGKTVVVTGAGRGIGQEICVGFADNGTNVIGVDIIDMGETAKRVAGAGGSWSEFNIDIGSPESVEKGCAEIISAAGRVDGLVNNASLYGGLKVQPMEQIDLDEWDKVMTVNARGTYLMIRYMAPALKQSKGKIVNIASGSVLRGSPGLMHYVASKGATIAMTRSMATELGAHEVCVNAIAPGFITTDASKGLSDMYDKYLEGTIAAQSIKKPNNADDIVGTVLYLTSDWADCVTGQVCAVDYGLNKN